MKNIDWFVQNTIYGTKYYRKLKQIRNKYNGDDNDYQHKLQR